MIIGCIDYRSIELFLMIKTIKPLSLILIHLLNVRIIQYIVHVRFERSARMFHKKHSIMTVCFQTERTQLINFLKYRQKYVFTSIHTITYLRCVLIWLTEMSIIASSIIVQSDDKYSM